MSLNLFKDLSLKSDDISRNYNLLCVDKVNKKVIELNRVEANVKSFGAVGDGIVDDTEAIQRAIDANPTYVHFPNGNYKVSNTLLFFGKPSLTVSFDGCTITNMGTNFAMRFEECPNVTVSGGFLIYGNVVNNGLRVNKTYGTFENIRIANCKDGVSLGQNYEDGSALTNFSNLQVVACQIGVTSDMAFCEFISPQISFCSLYGMFIIGDNCIVNGGFVSKCRIGLWFDGFRSRGTLNGVTVNESSNCGVFLKNLSSFNISGCKIWNSGVVYPAVETLSTRAEPARTSIFGMYFENVKNVICTSNTIGYNQYNIGIDGYAVCSFTGNSFIAGTNKTIAHVREYGKDVEYFTGNKCNGFVGNSFYGQVFGLNPNLKKAIEFHQDLESNNYRIEGNVTSGVPDYLHIDAAFPILDTPVLFDANYSHLVVNRVSTIVSLHPSVGGKKFTITHYGMTQQSPGGKRIFTSSDTSLGGRVPTILARADELTWTSTDGNKGYYELLQNGTYTFIPTGDYMNEWIVSYEGSREIIY